MTGGAGRFGFRSRRSRHAHGRCPGHRALRQVRVELEFGQHRAGDHDVAGVTGQLQHLAGDRRGHFDHRLGGFHRHQRLVQADHVAFLDEPLDDGRVGQAFAEVGKMEGLAFAHEGSRCLYACRRSSSLSPQAKGRAGRGASDSAFDLQTKNKRKKDKGTPPQSSPTHYVRKGGGLFMPPMRASRPRRSCPRSAGISFPAGTAGCGCRSR